MAIIRPTINFVAHPKGNPSTYWSCVRTGNAAYTNATGNLLVAGPNTIRQDFDIGTREFMGMLVEAPSTNLLLAQNKNNRELLSGSYTVSGSITAVSASSQGVKDNATGTLYNTCTLINSTGITGQITISVPVTQSQKYSISVYVRKHPNSAVDPQVKFIVNGTETGSPFTVSSIYDWKRIGITFDTNSPTSIIGLKILNAAMLYADYLQVEPGNRTSPIYRSATNGVRFAETVKLQNNIYTSGAIDQNEGTIYIEFHPGGNVAKFNNSWFGLVTIGNTLSSNNLGAYIVMNPVSGANLAIQSNIYPLLSMPITKVDYNVPNWYKVAFSYKSDSKIKACISGGGVNEGENFRYSIDTTTAGSLLLGAYDYNPNKYYLDGHVRHFAYFPKYFSNDDLVALTS